jgi:hypothetical protein
LDARLLQNGAVGRGKAVLTEGKNEMRKPGNFEMGKSNKARPITAALIRVGESKLPERERKKLGLGPGATWFDGIAAGMVRAAVRGDAAAAREIREAIEGKAPLHVELSGEITLADFVRKVVAKAAA